MYLSQLSHFTRSLLSYPSSNFSSILSTLRFSTNFIFLYLSWNLSASADFFCCFFKAINWVLFASISSLFSLSLPELLILSSKRSISRIYWRVGLAFEEVVAASSFFGLEIGRWNLSKLSMFLGFTTCSNLCLFTLSFSFLATGSDMAESSLSEEPKSMASLSFYFLNSF